MPCDFVSRPSRTLTWTALAFLVIASSMALPSAPAADPSLTYTLTPEAYNNTVRVANATDMLAPRIAVGPDPTGMGSVNVYVIGVDRSPCGDLVTVRSADGGQTFGAQHRAPLCLGGAGVDAVVAPNGTLIVLTAGPRVYRSFDGGASWALAATLDSSGDSGTVARDSVSGDVYAAWNVHVSVSRDGGGTWSNTSSNPPIAASVTQPSIAAYGGNLVVAFTDWGPDTPNGPFGHETTGVVISPDGGATWSPVKDLAPRGSAYRVGATSASVSVSGVFGVTWAAIDFNYTTWTLVSGSKDGGATWSPAFRVAEGGEIFVTWPFGRSTVFDSAGRVFTAWHGFTNSGAFAITVASSDANLTAFNESSFTIRFQSSVVNSTGVENLAADNASRVFLVWEVPTIPGPDQGVYVRTVTGAATGNVQGAATTAVTLRGSTAGGVVRQVTWTGQAFLLPELPPDEYQVWTGTGNSSALAGTIPVQPWGRTAFTVYVVSSGPPPPVTPFPWLPVAAFVIVLAAVGAAALQYTRITRENVLQRKVRFLLFEYIRDHPGTRFTEVRDAIGLQNGAAAYHLSVLEKQGFVHSETKRHRRWYYPSGDASLWKDLPVSPVQDSILRTVRERPGIAVRELSRTLNRGPSSVGYNVRALSREGLLRVQREGLLVRCYPSEAAGT